MALTRSPLSRFALHFARLSGYLDSGCLVRVLGFPEKLTRKMLGVIAAPSSGPLIFPLDFHAFPCNTDEWPKYEKVLVRVRVRVYT